MAFLLLFSACSKAKEPAPLYGGMRVLVTDGMSFLPIEGACVTVPETGESFITGADGLTPLLKLPVIPDSEYDALLPCPCGRVTLIASAEGFTPYLLLYARVFPDEERRVELLLFPDDGTLKTFTVIEAPPNEWSDKLAEKFAGRSE